MSWLLIQWGRFIWWVDHLSPRVAAMLGAVGLVLVAGIGKYFLVPFLNWAFRELGRRLYGFLAGRFLIDRLVALPKYCKSVQITIGRLRNPWLLESQQLENIFVPISVSRGPGSAEHYDVRSLPGRLRAVMIVGDPGSGKTTALKTVAMDSVRQWRRDSSAYVPVYIPLRAWGTAGVDLMTYVEQLFAENDFPNAGNRIKKLKARGKLAFLLDGLDEGRKDYLVAEIRALLKNEIEEPRCLVYITSRPVGYDGQFADLIEETAEMDEFSPAQIQQFIGNWKFQFPKSAAKLFQVLVSRPPIFLICRNPLMLTIVTYLYVNRPEYQLPDSRSSFYKVCVQALLTKWDAAQEKERNRYSGELKEAFLWDLAHTYLSEGARDLSAPLVLKQVEGFLADRKVAEANADVFLQEIVRSGLVDKLPTGQLVFAHKTFAESLVSSRFHNKPEELMKLWEAEPDTWLEVCSLYVSDQLTLVGDIKIVLEAAMRRPAWHTAIVLAGEAHTPLDETRIALVRRVQTDRSLWSIFDKRAMASLARFGNAARPLLTDFMKEPAAEIRQLAVYALGQCGADWATDLLVAALTDPATEASAAEALGGLGEDAVVLIEDLLRTRAGNAPLARACAVIAGRIGTPGALRAIMPLLWSEAAPDAALQIIRLLSLPELRAALEAGGIVLPAPSVREPDDLAEWAFPWLPETNATLRAYYAWLCRVVLERPTPTSLDALPTDFLVPVLIELGKVRRGLGEPRGTVKLVGFELSKRTDAKNRELWSRAAGDDKKDLALSPRVSRLIWNLATVGLMAITVRGAMSHVLSWWWLGLFLPWVGLVSWAAISERDLSTLAWIGVTNSAPFNVLHSWSRMDGDDRGVYGLMALQHVLLIACAVLSTWRLGGPWLALACLVTPTALQVEFEKKFTDLFIVLLRRSNPLRKLRNSLSKGTPEATPPSSAFGLAARSQTSGQ